jgi:hypothetical protein
MGGIEVVSTKFVRQLIEEELSVLRAELSVKTDLLRLRDIDIYDLNERNDRLEEMIEGDKKELEKLEADNKALAEALESSRCEFERLLGVIGDADFDIVKENIAFIKSALEQHGK